MERKSVLALALVFLLSVSCSGKNPQGPVVESLLRVYVYFDEHGVANRRLEIAELGIEKVTDESGNATFALPAGSYTLLAYLNGPGPVTGPQEIAVRTMPGKVTRVELYDCEPCVIPSPSDRR